MCILSQVNRELSEVIESLKQKNEENGELAEEPSEEETDGIEGASDEVGETSKGSGENSEATSAQDSLQNPSFNVELERPQKRNKIDGEENDITLEKANGDGLDTVPQGKAELTNCSSKDMEAGKALEEANDSPPK